MIELRWHVTHSVTNPAVPPSAYDTTVAVVAVKELQFRTRAILLDAWGSPRGLSDWSAWTVVPESTE